MKQKNNNNKKIYCDADLKSGKLGVKVKKRNKKRGSLEEVRFEFRKKFEYETGCREKERKMR